MTDAAAPEEPDDPAPPPRKLMLEKEDPRLWWGMPEPEGLRSPEAGAILDSCRNALIHIVARFWTPWLLITLKTLLRVTARDFRKWFDPIELALRRFVALEAALLAQTLDKPQPKPKSEPKQRKAREPKGFDRSYPPGWPVSFQLLPPYRSGDDARGGEAKAKPSAMINPHSLACRLEAAIRVAENPFPFIRRLALRLKTRGIPAARRLLRPARGFEGAMKDALDPLARQLNALIPWDDTS